MTTKFAVGQKVRVKSITKNNNDYITEMEKTIGRVYTIKEMNMDAIYTPYGLDVPGAKGENDLFWYSHEDIEIIPQFTKGDRVKGCGKSISGYYDVSGSEGTVKNPDYITGEGQHCIYVIWDDNNNGDLVVADNLIKISPKKLASISTRKCVVGGVDCREILGFDNILKREELPDKYVWSIPRFYIGSADYLNPRIFNGKIIELGNKHTKETTCLSWCFEKDEHIMGKWSFDLLVGDIIPEKNFQLLITGMKRAGENLIRIKKEIAVKEKEEAEKKRWSGCEVVEI